MRQRLAASLVLLTTVPMALSGCGTDVQEAPGRRRAVTTYELTAYAPVSAVRTTGVAEPYRQADVGFEVAGKVELVRDVGDEVQGPNRVAGGGETPGEVIAEIDPLRYEQAVKALGLKLQSAEAGRDALHLEATDLAAATIKRASAQLDAADARIQSALAALASADATLRNAQVERERQERLLRNERISKSDFDASDTVFQNAKASHDQAQATLDATREERNAADAGVVEAHAAQQVKRGALKQAEAEIEELKEQLARADTDLEDCRLRAPFSGRITGVHVSRGWYVTPGKPVLTLTLVDPIKIASTVSGDEERRIQPGTFARIQPGVPLPVGKEASLLTFVREKASIADAATRTFRVEVMMRNWRLLDNLPPKGSTAEVIDGGRVIPVLRPFAGEGGPIMALDDCFVDRGGKTYLALLPAMRKSATLRMTGAAAVALVEVRTRPVFHTFLSFTFQAFEPVGGPERVVAGDMLVVFPRTLDDVDLEEAEAARRADLAAAGQNGVFIARSEWAIRPGDLVPIAFETGTLPEGFYVPVRAILDLNGEKSVFVVDADGVAHRVPVVPAMNQAEARGELRRVDGEGLEDGLRIAVDGVQYLSDGVRVEVVGKARMDPNYGDGGSGR